MKNVIKALLVAWLIPAVALADRPEGEIVTFYLTDHLGTPVVAMDEAGDVLWTREYSAFGEALENEDEVQVGYTGHEFVPESGLSYMEARWYNPVMGRFLQPDPVGFTDSNTLSFNRYLYVNNSPYVGTDPDGEYVWLVEIASITVGLASAIYHYSQGDMAEAAQDMAFVAADGISLVLPAVGVGGLTRLMNKADDAFDGGRALSNIGRGADNLPVKIERKIERQMTRRGWDRRGISDTVNNPHRTVQVRDTRHMPDGTRRNDPATAYIREDGHYVVRNDTDGSIVQVSDTRRDDWVSPFDE